MFFKKLSIGLIALVWAVVALWPQYSRTPALEIWMLSVGQGEAVLIREPGGKLLLYDGGPDDTALTELGGVLPAWVRTIDVLILSHTHSDHIRGFIPILARYSIKEVWTSGVTSEAADFKAWQTSLVSQQLTPRVLALGPAFNYGQLTILPLHPPLPLDGPVKQAHDANLVLKLSYGNNDILLTGDLYLPNIRDLIKGCPPPDCSLQAEILQVPHHGSDTGITNELLDRVDPDYALISVGIDNRYQHPRPEALKLLSERSIKTLRTDQSGRIHLVIGKTQVSVDAGQSVPR